MKPGSEYEEFIFQAFSRFLRGFQIKKNDKIVGTISGLSREIDVSMRANINGADLLYITQAKDHNRPADIKIIGEFSSVIQDVGASKGFLICASGFAHSIREYARKQGIELLTVEDINSDKWCVEVEIPIELLKYDIQFDLICPTLVTNYQRRSTSAPQWNDCRISFNFGDTFGSFKDELAAFVTRRSIDLKSPHSILLPKGCLQFDSLQYAIDTGRATIELKPTKRRFMKYVKPSEYLVIKDHLRAMEIPVNLNVPIGSLTVDDTWTEVPGGQLPVRPAGISISCELHPHVDEIAKMNWNITEDRNPR